MRLTSRPEPLPWIVRCSQPAATDNSRGPCKTVIATGGQLRHAESRPRQPTWCSTTHTSGPGLIGGRAGLPRLIHRAALDCTEASGVRFSHRSGFQSHRRSSPGEPRWPAPESAHLGLRGYGFVQRHQAAAGPLTGDASCPHLGRHRFPNRGPNRCPTHRSSAGPSRSILAR